MTNDEIKEQLQKLKGWSIGSEEKVLSKSYDFSDFLSAMDFANKITDIAEQEQHHPDLQISWGRVVVHLSTHSLGGLSVQDFILAEKIDTI